MTVRIELTLEENRRLSRAALQAGYPGDWITWLERSEPVRITSAYRVDSLDGRVRTHYTLEFDNEQAALLFRLKY